MLLLLLALALLATARPALAQTSDINNEYRVTLFPSHPIKDNLTGFGYLGYVANPDKDYTTYYVGWPGVTYTPSKIIQYWGGAIYSYTDNEIKSDKLEVRPFVGFNLFLPNDRKMNLYNFTRYEARIIQDRTSHDWATPIIRVRTRFGIEAPLGSRERAWKPGATYALADVEPFYRFDRNTVDPLRWHVGLGHVFEEARARGIHLPRPAHPPRRRHAARLHRQHLAAEHQDRVQERPAGTRDGAEH